MKISARTPSRISLAGGGTDLEPYCGTYGGMVVNLAINLRQQIQLFTDDDMYTMDGNNFFPFQADPQFYFHIAKHFNLDGMHAYTIQSDFDGFIKCGLGSSGSAAVCMIGAINKLKGLNLTRGEIAQKAYELETSFGVKTGYQDHLAAVYGGLALYDLMSKKRYPLPREAAEALVDSLVMFYMGKSRNSSFIQHGFENPTSIQILTLDKIRDLAQEMYDLLLEYKIDYVGELLDRAWELKKQSNKVSTPEIDKIYKKGMDHGAWGGKILGAGGGGYFLFSVNPTKRKQFIKNMDMEEIDFGPCFNGLDARIL